MQKKSPCVYIVYMYKNSAQKNHWWQMTEQTLVDVTVKDLLLVISTGKNDRQWCSE